MRAAGQQHGDHRHMLGAQAAQQRHIVLVARTVFERGHIARPFRVRVLAEHHDRDVGTGVELARLAQLRRAARGRHAARDARVDRLRMRKVLVGLGALPADRPAAALLGDAVGAITGDENARMRRERQKVTAVLQKHQRFAHRLARHGAMHR
jgi:hypothetical protein